MSRANDSCDTPPSTGTGEKPILIAVIEDESIVLVGYQMLFESWGYEVAGAGTAEEVIALLRGRDLRPRVILADYRLREGYTGVMAIRAVQAEFGTDIPAILVTGDTAPGRLREAAASGLPILHKPVNGNQLHTLLQYCLSGTAAVSG
ncbi:MAG: response regulator [Rhodospirillaceae bacterium]|nr:response regulator [Rhodospirillaceae bacterium]